MNINKAIVIGRITSDLKLQATATGVNILKFSVATNYKYKNSQGQPVEEVEFHNISAFGKTAENVAKYFVKGQEIYVEGRLKTSSWDDQKTGAKMYKTEIILDKFDFGQKPQGYQQPAAAVQTPPPAPGAPMPAQQQAATIPGTPTGVPQSAPTGYNPAGAPQVVQQPPTPGVEFSTDDINPEDIPF